MRSGAPSVLLVGGLILCAAMRALGNSQDSEAKNASESTLVYVGTQTGAKSGDNPGDNAKGIYLFRLQTDNLEVSQNITLVPLGLAAETPNPTFLDLDVKRRLLFAVNETDDFEGKPSGSVSAFSIDAASGKLTLLNQRASLGSRPCQLILDKDVRNAIVANCASASLTVLPIAADGRLSEATTPTPIGKAPATDAQSQPAPADAAARSQPAAADAAASNTVARCLTLDPANRFAFACDAASDRILIYRFDPAKSALTPSAPAFAALKAGAGPRYLVFRPDGRFAYVGNELNSTITVFAYDANTGALSETQTISTLPEYFEGENAAAEVGMHPSGKYLYVSNRGHNSVVLFTIDSEQGTLTFVEEQGTGGKNPRHFGIEPSAKHLAIANQESNTLLASRIDAGNGRLKPSGVFASAPSPVFVKFLPPTDGK
jgi:6-phosphogluconolactonase